jgi:hypothetical protein
MAPTQSRRYLRKFTFARTVDQVSNSRCAMLLRHTETAGGVDAVNTLRVAQALSRPFPSFRAFKFSISAVQRAFESGFDSRQLHREDAGQGDKPWPASLFRQQRLVQLLCRLHQSRLIAVSADRVSATPANRDAACCSGESPDAGPCLIPAPHTPLRSPMPRSWR